MKIILLVMKMKKNFFMMNLLNVLYFKLEKSKMKMRYIINIVKCGMN